MDDFEDSISELTPTSSSSSHSDQIISTKNQFPSTCKVCRHPATGYHYNSSYQPTNPISYTIISYLYCTA
ncbi:unnamed protein product [Caenorhabditis nigoni]